MHRPLLSNPDPRPRKKHWVRLTGLCNNGCVFCLDSDDQNGAVVPVSHVVSDLRKGRDGGCTQAVLSGGEPTLHPDFITIVSEAKSMGYGRVQVITNGRMFRYPGFLENAAAAGLDEITFSLHEIEPDRFDALTRTPGSFQETMKGFMLAQASDAVDVSVDIVLSGMNAGRLTTIVSGLAALGAREFDILYPIPFGRAWVNRDRIFFNIAHFIPDLLAAIAFCEKQGLRIWMNRIPCFALEGAERFIQSPRKLQTEVIARMAMFEDFANRGIPPPCKGARCELCHVHGFCSALGRLASSISNRAPVPLLITPQNVDRLSHPFPFTPQTLILNSNTIFDAAPVQKILAQTNGLRTELICSGIPDVPLQASAMVSRLYLEINKRTASELIANGVKTIPQTEVKLLLNSRLTLEETLDLDTSISAFIDRFVSQRGSEVGLINVPPCLSGREPYEGFSGISADVFAVGGGVDIERFTEHYMTFGMFGKSVRCSGCRHSLVCPGLGINHIRAFGLSNIPGCDCQTLKRTP